MVNSISRSFPPAPPRPTAPDYHHYVTSLLHRRWMRVCLVVIFVCYVECWLVTSKRSLFWSLLSVAPFKAALLSFTMLPVLIMRVQLVHLGSLVRSSAAADIQHFLGSFKTYATVMSYVLSALTFVFMYMGTSDERDQLGITVEARYERPRLNERFLYLIFLAVWSSLVHTCTHLASDRDRVDLPGVKLQKTANEEITLGGKKAIQLGDIILKEAQDLFPRVLQHSAITSITGMFGYLACRGTMWRYTLRIARVFYRISNSPEPYTWPVGFLFFIRTYWISFLIFSLWEITQSMFKLYFSLEPLKDNKPLSDSSVDPNGTLITGFKHTRKPFTRSLAFWELVYITFNIAERRRSFFTDIDRPVRIIDEIIKECLAVLDETNTVIQQKDQPPPPPSQSSTISLAELTTPSKRPSFQPIRGGDEAFLYPPISRSIPDVLRPWQSKDGTILGETVNAKLQPYTPDMGAKKEQVRQELNSVSRKFMGSQAGKPFRQTVERKTQALIPNVKLQIDAAVAMSKLAIYALSEDEFGTMGKHVGAILEKLFNGMDTLEAYLESPGIHWSDTDSGGAENIKLKLKEPKELLDVLRKCARDMVVAYRPYLGDLNLSVKVGKRARKVLEDPVDD